MCRWVAWSGNKRYFEDLLFSPVNSLLQQSREALFCKSSVNADGYGMAWYSDRDNGPCVYKSIMPAWADDNLQQLAHYTSANLFLAHVRASTGSAIARSNCHPFKCAEWSFMHNGQLGGYEQFRKRLDMKIEESIYGNRQGTSDSEAIFLHAIGLGLTNQPIKAMAAALGTAGTLARQFGQKPHVRFAACWSNGKQLFAARFATDNHAPSLHYCIEQQHGTIIASEPLDRSEQQWQELAPGQAMIVVHDQVKIVNFLPVVS